MTNPLPEGVPGSIAAGGIGAAAEDRLAADVLDHDKRIGRGGRLLELDADGGT